MFSRRDAPEAQGPRLTGDSPRLRTAPARCRSAPRHPTVSGLWPAGNSGPRLIRRIYEVDPFLCRFGERVGVVGFITQAPVVRKIQRSYRATRRSAENPRSVAVPFRRLLPRPLPVLRPTVRRPGASACGVAGSVEPYRSIRPLKHNGLQEGSTLLVRQRKKTFLPGLDSTRRTTSQAGQLVRCVSCQKKKNPPN